MRLLIWSATTLRNVYTVEWQDGRFITKTFGQRQATTTTDCTLQDTLNWLKQNTTLDNINIPEGEL